MSTKPLPREEFYPEMLLQRARYWRNCAAQSKEPSRSAVMRAAAEELETTAVDIIRQTVADPQRARVKVNKACK